MKSIFDNVSFDCSVKVTKAYSTSFSSAVKMLAPSIRQDIYNIYGFVRMADEIVDSFLEYDREMLLNRFEKELYRFGGLYSLRGFDEESLTASAYTMAKSEISYILEQNSYLFVFYNIAWYERNLGDSYTSDYPFGFGAGLTFETKLGIFSFSYALGKEFDNPIKIRAEKIHFGLINYF